MATPIWKSAAARPLGIGGGAVLISWPEPPAGETLEEVVGLIGLAPAVTQADPGFARVVLAADPNAEEVAWGLPPVADLVVSFFAKTSTSGWSPAEVVTGLDVQPTTAIRFPWLKPWLIARLQDYMRDLPPFPDREVPVRGSFPRDAHGRPAISVTYDAAPPSQSLLGSLGRVRPSIEHSRAWNITMSVIAWCDEPETRDTLSEWMGAAMSAILEFCPLVDLTEPSLTLEESEDFQTLGIPTFLTTARLSGASWSSVKLPPRNWVGHITV